MSERPIPRALENLRSIEESIGGRTPVFFLDFDGTLVPVVSHPESARLTVETKDVLRRLARDRRVCIISGRGLADLRSQVGIDTLYYAAEHGYRVVGPKGSEIDLEVGPEDRRGLEAAAYEIEARLRDVAGVVVETKGASLSVHYRMVASPALPLVHKVVARVVGSHPGLRMTSGKMVHEIRPDIDWGKGRAILWLLTRLRLDKHETCPICIGDDLTDEDMYSATADFGISVVVGEPGRLTYADYSLRDPDETRLFLEAFVRGWRGARHPLI